MIQAYVDVVSRLPFVEQVLAMPGYEGVGIWTVIDSEPFEDESSNQVCDAELKAWDQCPKALVQFRVINRREHGDEAMEWAVPQNAHVAWRRTPQA